MTMTITTGEEGQSVLRQLEGGRGQVRQEVLEMALMQCGGVAEAAKLGIWTIHRNDVNGRGMIPPHLWRATCTRQAQVGAGHDPSMHTVLVLTLTLLIPFPFPFLFLFLFLLVEELADPMWHTGKGLLSGVWGYPHHRRQGCQRKGGVHGEEPCRRIPLRRPCGELLEGEGEASHRLM